MECPLVQGKSQTPVSSVVLSQLMNEGMPVEKPSRCVGQDGFFRDQTEKLSRKLQAKNYL